MKKGCFFCFIGIDGTGKSTLTKMVIHDFANHEQTKFSYVYCRYNPILLKPIILLARKLLFDKNKKDITYKTEYVVKKGIFSNRHIAAIYEAFLLFDYSFQIFYKVTFPLLIGTNIICDRYIFDTILTDLSVDLNYSHEKTLSILHDCFKVFPKPDITFLLDVSEDIAIKRKVDILSIDYLKDRRKKYLEIAPDLNFIILNAEKPINNLLIESKSYMKRFLFNE